MLILAAAQVGANDGARCEGSRAMASQRITKGTALVVSNVEFTQLSHPNGGSAVLITYDLASPAGAASVSVEVSDNNGVSFDILPATMTGAVGPAVQPGEGLQILWHVSQDLPNVAINQAVIRVTADDGTCSDCLYWSDNASWASLGIGKPANDHNVTIPAGVRMILDEDTAQLGGLTIEGTLEFAREDVALTADWIMLHGELLIGSETQPFTHQATITLTDDNIANSVMGMGTRGIMVMGGGVLSLHGAPPTVPWTKINQHLPVGETSVTLMENVDWQSGDEVILAPTGYHTFTPNILWGITERLTLASDAANNILTTLAGPQNARWGRLQYATTNGMSETQPAPGSPEEIVLPPAMADTPLVLDQRAAIGNLTRNIVIQAPDDTAWQDHGFGVHIMVMGQGSAAYVNGVEIRRGGQRNSLGRYPFHWHMLSYNPPNEIGDATGQYIRNSVIHESMNRGIVVHGTNGVLVQNNIVYNVRGHGVFLEDGVERRNTFDRNLVLRVRDPQPGFALKLHESEAAVGNGGSSGFWIANPDNIVTNNHAADCSAFGYWLAFSFRPFGESAPHADPEHPGNVQMRPQRMALHTFSHNTAHSNRQRGIMIDFVEIAQSGAVGGLQYFPSPDYDGLGPGSGYENRIPFFLTDLGVWKNGHNGIWDRASGSRNLRIVSADNCNKFFAGSGNDGLIANCLVIGNSLNQTIDPGTGHPYRPNFTESFYAGFATYHSDFSVQDNVVMNFPLIPGTTSGVFAEDDFYDRPVEKGTVRNSGNIIQDSHPGFKSIPVWSGGTVPWQYPGNDHTFQPFASWFTFAAAKWDPHGWAGPADNYLVYNAPFLTWGTNVSPITPDLPAAHPSTWGAQNGAVSAQGPYYGFLAFVLHGEAEAAPANLRYNDYMTLHARRYDPATLVEGSDPGRTGYIDTWIVDGSTPPGNGRMLEHMRDVAAHWNGIYELDFVWDQYHPGWGFDENTYRYPTDLQMEVENMLETTDKVLIGIHFNGNNDATVFYDLGARTQNFGAPDGADIVFNEVFSFNAIRNSPGMEFYQDHANNRVWVMLQGGHWIPDGSEPLSNPVLYQTMYLRIN